MILTISYLNKKTKKGGTLYHASKLISYGSNSSSHYQIYVIDGQNINQIKEYKQWDFAKIWNPCIPIPFDTEYNSAFISITFVSNQSNNFRDWYPLQICDYPYNFMNYSNQYLFDGGYVVNIYNLNIDNYIINDNTNYPIARNLGKGQFSIHNGIFINISSSTTDPCFIVLLIITL